MEAISSLIIAILLCAGSYFAFLERAYLHDQVIEIGDISIIRWRRVFSLLTALLAIGGFAFAALAVKVLIG